MFWKFRLLGSRNAEEEKHPLAIVRRTCFDQLFLGLPLGCLWIFGFGLLGSDLTKKDITIGSVFKEHVLKDNKWLEAWASNLSFWVPQTILSYWLQSKGLLAAEQHLIFGTVCSLPYGMILTLLAERQQRRSLAK